MGIALLSIILNTVIPCKSSVSVQADIVLHIDTAVCTAVYARNRNAEHKLSTCRLADELISSG